MGKARSRLSKLNRQNIVGEEVTKLTSLLNCVDAAICLTPERILQSNIAEVASNVKAFEQGGMDIPAPNMRLISILHISDSLAKNNLKVALECVRSWGHRDDPEEWTAARPLLSLVAYNPAEDDAAKLLEHTLKGVLNTGLCNMIAMGNTETPQAWAEGYLSSMQKAQRQIATLPTAVQDAVKTAASYLRALLAIVSPVPYPYQASPDDVENLVPSNREKRRKLDPWVMHMKDTIVQNTTWNALYEEHKAARTAESIRGKDMLQASDQLRGCETMEQTKEALYRCCSSLLDWRKELRQGATKGIEQQMLKSIDDLLPSLADSADDLLKLLNIMPCFEGGPAMQLTAKITSMQKKAASQERASAWSAAVAAGHPQEMLEALQSMKGQKLHRDFLLQLLSSMHSVEDGLVNTVTGTTPASAKADTDTTKPHVAFLNYVFEEHTTALNMVTKMDSTTFNTRMQVFSLMACCILRVASAIHGVNTLPADVREIPWKGEGWDRVHELQVSCSELDKIGKEYSVVLPDSEAQTTALLKALAEASQQMLLQGQQFLSEISEPLSLGLVAEAFLGILIRCVCG